MEFLEVFICQRLKPPALAAVIGGHWQCCDPPSVPFGGCWRGALLSRAALILLGIFSLPDRAEECLRPPQGAGESSWPRAERAPAVPGAAPLPWAARPEPGMLALPGGRGGGGITPARHSTLAAWVEMRMDFYSLLGFSVTPGTKDRDYNLQLLCPPVPALAGGNPKPTSSQAGRFWKDGEHKLLLPACLSKTKLFPIHCGSFSTWLLFLMRACSGKV